MLGKSIDQIRSSDIHQMIADGSSEGLTLEFKRDIPVHSQQQAKGITEDRSWTKAKPLSDYGRDELAAEVVAFANASGGTVVLGMDEFKGNPPIASGINPLPDVAGLERKLKDAFNNCIEPRLPYLAVRGIATEPDGSGVVVIETSPSTAGPHWVRKTRQATIRREDRCDPLTMTELQDMVLRKSKSLAAAERQMEDERAAFSKIFEDSLTRLVDEDRGQFHGDPIGRIGVWIKTRNKAAFGVQVTLTPHFDLGIPRLESLQGLYPGKNAIRLTDGGQRVDTAWIAHWDFVESFVKKILGGVISMQANDNKTQIVKVMRDGRVTVSFIHVRHEAECTLFASNLAAGLGVAIGVFDRLRGRSTYPAAAADVAVDICTVGRVGVGVYEEYSSMGQWGVVAPHVAFPTYTIGDTQDFPALFHEVLGDLMNMVDKRAADLQQLEWSDPR